MNNETEWDPAASNIYFNNDYRDAEWITVGYVPMSRGEPAGFVMIGKRDAYTEHLALVKAEKTGRYFGYSISQDLSRRGQFEEVGKTFTLGGARRDAQRRLEQIAQNKSKELGVPIVSVSEAFR